MLADILFIGIIVIIVISATILVEGMRQRQMPTHRFKKFYECMYSLLAGYSFFKHGRFYVPRVTISAAKDPLIVNTEDFACMAI